jgi:hypothetical protein
LSLEALQAADRHVGEVLWTVPTLVRRTRRMGQKQCELGDHGDVDGRWLTKPLG